MAKTEPECDDCGAPGLRGLDLSLYHEERRFRGGTMAQADPVMSHRLGAYYRGECPACLGEPALWWKGWSGKDEPCPNCAGTAQRGKDSPYLYLRRDFKKPEAQQQGEPNGED